jgi:hypothetical protein
VTIHISIWALLTLWAALLFGGALFGRWDADETHRIPTWARMASSFVLVALAWDIHVLYGGPIAPYSLLIALGMTLGFLGDLFMARLIPVQQHVLGGMGAFALGHVAYVAAILGFGDRLGINDTAVRLGAWAALLLIGAVAWLFVVRRGGDWSPLHIAALPYALLLASTAGFALGMALQDGHFIPLAIGAALFLGSDLILADQIFNGTNFRGIGDAIWLTYGPAQMLIVMSVVTAASLAAS